MPASSDEALLERAAAGEEAAFRELVERFTPRVFAVARNLVHGARDAEDVTQEVFFKVYSKLSGFRQESAFSTWLYRVTVNAAADYIKKRRQDRSTLVDELEKLPLEAPGEAPDEDLGRQDLRREVRAAMAELPEKFRTILVLRELEGLPYGRISEILGISKGTVESRLFRARARLKERLERSLRT